MTYYIGNEVSLNDILGTGNPRFFYALRRTDDGQLYFAKIDQLKDTDTMTVNVAGPNEQNFEDFEYGVDYFDGRLAEDHSRPFQNLYYDQYRWDGKNMYYYINNAGELVVRINQKYIYPVTFIGSITGTTLTVESILSGIVEIGMLLSAPELTTDTTILSQLTGVANRTGTYSISHNYGSTPPLPTSVTIIGTAS
ncbi:hypothetical protein UFOVP181_358 [uncultured Caudovirales phage]|uniref:Uncharacterized protein n=1 Tax=uncultured Caudovirales phage TaxID=2100421 RepID=A0A6J5L0H6_9CAUD|nr:hypothetical protein UFOVP57_281 [uncultured Caudovirales phage]CAB5209210.1 hypothetical protein UFOVP181_358 [uncultured Caudovirales phage]